jgi:hypothetical protein
MDKIIENIEKGIANGKAKAEANSKLNDRVISRGYSMDYKKPMDSGRKAFLAGKKRGDNPCYPYNANAGAAWDQGWKEMDDGKYCAGIEIEPGIFSGCDQTGGDCPRCGK